MDGTVHNGLTQFGKCHVFKASPLFDSLTQVHEQDQTVFSRQSKTSDVTNPHSDAKIETKEPLKQDATSNSSRHGQSHNQQGVHEIVISDIEN